MTSLPNVQGHETDGRTVREIVEYNHEMVSEAFCRRIFRQILQSLEVQYGMRMPHRPITPDAILILGSGDPMLLPDGVAFPELREGEDVEARDLRDLAAVVHYAITLELAPAGPLRGRALPEYSDGFLAAVDRCLAPDAARRPRTIAELRDLLGIVVLGPPVAAVLADGAAPPLAGGAGTAPTPAAAAPVSPPPASTAPLSAPPLSAPASVPGADPAPSGAIPARLQRWLMVGGAILVLLAALAALFALLRQSDSRDALALTLPQEQAPAAPAPARGTPLVTLAQDRPAAPDGMGDDGASPGHASPGHVSPGHASPGRVSPGRASPQLEGPVIDETGAAASQAASAAPAAPPTAVQLAPAGVAAADAVAGTTYTLLVRPWGRIVVDGVERGVSPPLRHITLPPGAHTIRIVNPGFPEHTVHVQSARGETGTIELDFTEETTP